MSNNPSLTGPIVAAPQRSFPTSEFETRLNRARQLMAEHNLDALLLTTEPELRYFLGFLTQFWQSPTRPWFMVVPLHGKPIDVPHQNCRSSTETNHCLHISNTARYG